MRKVLILALALLGATAPVPRSSQYVFAWATEIGPTAKSAGQDFLAVFNAAPDSADFGKLVAFLPVGKTGTFTHHSNNDLRGRRMQSSKKHQLWNNFHCDMFGQRCGLTSAPCGGPLDRLSVPRLATRDGAPRYAFELWMKVSVIC